MNKQRIAIADIHGELEMLELLLEAIEYDPTYHQLIFLGDYVDRGPDSAGVLRLVRELQKHDGNVALRGNHERLMISAVKRVRYDDILLWELNGGDKTNQSFSGKRKVEFLNEYCDWLLSLPLYHEDADYFFSHAPLPPDVAINDRSQWECVKTNEQILTWSYFLPESDALKIPNKIGVCGHVHALRQGISEPRFYPHYYYLDGGCGCHHTGQLWAVNLDAGTYTNHRGETKEIRVES